MAKANVARSGSGSTVSKSLHARSGDIAKMVVTPDKQPGASSNIPGSDSRGVPPAEADKMGAFARTGNEDLVSTIVAMQRGMTSFGPATAAAVARQGGQVSLSPGQVNAWANPRPGV